LRLYRPEQIKTRPNMQEPNLTFLADFYSHISALDTEMGRILTALDRQGLADDTIVLFTADHGDMLSSHGKWDKQIWYEESINVPFLLRYPRRAPAGRRQDTVVNVVDIMPTLLALAGLPIPKSVEGEDLSAVVTGGKPREDRMALIANYMPFARQAFPYPEWRGVRTPTHTYVESRQGPLEFFDNRRDPHQLNNLVNRPEHAAFQSRLATRLKSLLEAANDRFEPRQHYWKRYNLDIGDQGQVRYRS